MIDLQYFVCTKNLKKRVILQLPSPRAQLSILYQKLRFYLGIQGGCESLFVYWKIQKDRKYYDDYSLWIQRIYG